MKLQDRLRLFKHVDIVSVSDLAGRGGDDTNAINDAIATVISRHSGGDRCSIGFGPRTYNYARPFGVLTAPIGIVGAGSLNTRVVLAKEFSGAAFSWSETWFKTTVPTWAALGVQISGLSIVGDLTSPNVQHGLMFYDRTDCLLLRDVGVWYMPGRALATGIIGTKTQAYLRESTIDGLRVFGCGNPGYPAVEFCTAGSGDATNTCGFSHIDIFGSRAEGLIIRNKNSGKNIGHLDFFRLRVEGTMAGTPLIPYDTLVIGDTGASYVGGVGPINVFGCSLIAPYTDQYALTIAAKDATVGAKIYELNFKGLNIGPGPGGGLNIQAGRTLDFDVFDNSVSGTRLTVGAAGKVGSPIVVRSRGLANAWSSDVDDTSVQSVIIDSRNNLVATGNPGVNNDGIHGYGPGSLWFIPGTAALWVCRSAGTGAAVWTSLAV